ncbi:MAG TPA: GNAT family N-acetyltransferase [Xanthobacteraceae bacterium]|nr:GNAT family N-acetyltransferase [Xanthobacteraceae bacterium]
MTIEESTSPSVAPLPSARRGPPGLIVRAREPGDWEALATLMQLPRVRWGTLRLPFASADETRKLMEKPPEGSVFIVAILDDRLVGAASMIRYKGRRNHVGDIGMFVHDDFQGRGIGSALLAALVDTADKWLNLQRLELAVYVDNEPAIRLYKRFGFVIEGTRRAAAFRDGAFVDDHVMARLRGI